MVCQDLPYIEKINNTQNQGGEKMSYWMYAVDSNGKTIEYKGDSGPLSAAIEVMDRTVAEEQGLKYRETRNPDRVAVYHYNSKPRIGCMMQVGSPYARSYSAQDYWTTTPVTEIIEERQDPDGTEHVIFKTQNSTYHWIG